MQGFMPVYYDSFQDFSQCQDNSEISLLRTPQSQKHGLRCFIFLKIHLQTDRELSCKEISRNLQVSLEISCQNFTEACTCVMIGRRKTKVAPKLWICLLLPWMEFTIILGNMTAKWKGDGVYNGSIGGTSGKQPS